MSQNLREEQLGALFFGGAEDFFGGADFDNLTFVEEDHAVGNGAGEAHFVGNDQHGHARAGQFYHHIEHFFNHFGVKGRGRFVEEHDFGLHRQGAGDGDPLLLAARELTGVLVGLVGDAYPFEQLQGGFFGFFFAPFAYLNGSQGDVLEHGQMREEIELLEDHTGFHANQLDVVGIIVEFDAIHNDGAALVFFEPVDGANEGGFARARRPKDDNDLAFADFKIDIFEGLEVPIPFADIFADDDWGAGFFAHDFLLWRPDYSRKIWAGENFGKMFTIFWCAFQDKICHNHFMVQSLKLFLLGLPRLEVDGAPLTFKRRKALNLLAWLCLNPGEHPRERLAALFWGDSDEEAARLSLRVTISDLRKSLGEDALIGGRDSLGISPTLLAWVDALEFEKLAKAKLAPGWQEALSLYRDDFLPDLYDDWALEWRDRLAQLRVETLLRLVGHSRSLADYENAIELGRQLLALDPANEAAHQHIMVCYEALGDRAAALRQYETCREALAGLGARPAPMTEMIYRRLQKSVAGASTPLTAHPTNLPTPLTSFIGREAELEAVENLLSPLSRDARPARLVTLLGPGGSGKTRLSIQAAAELVDTYEQGVWWVELASLTRPEDVLTQAAAVFGLKEQPGVPLEESLLEMLKPRHFLLVLDNCEHLLDACARLCALVLQRCPRSQILATSREALSIGGEQVYPVPPLELPAEGPTDPETAAQIESLRLFVERARSVLPAFALDAANLPAVTAICRRLDGIPLAIELAVSRLKALSPAQIAERLDDRFRLLDSGDRAALPRQKTLYALIDWSYGLLDEDEKTLFRRLAILPGGCTLEAAEALGADLASHPLDLLTRLVEKSLLVARETDTGMRYRMLDSIRHFGLHRLAEANETDLAPARALNYFAQMVDEMEPHISAGNSQDIYLPRIAVEQDNLRELLEWSLRHQPQIALRLSGGLSSFWYLSDQAIEGNRWLSRALANGPDDNNSRWLTRALSGAGTMAWYLGDYHKAANLHRQALEGYRRQGNLPGELDSMNHLAVILQQIEKKQEAIEMWEVALKKARETEHKKALVFCANNLGLYYLGVGDFQRAESLLTECLQVTGPTSNHLTTVILHNLGDVKRYQGDPDSAFSYYNHSMENAQEQGATSMIAINLWGKGMTYYQKHEYRVAFALQQQALAYIYEIKRFDHTCTIIQGLAVAYSQLAPPQQAIPFFAFSKALQQSTRLDELTSFDDEQAQNVLDSLRAQLTPLEFDLAWQEGWHWTLEQAVERALAISV